MILPCGYRDLYVTNLLPQTTFNFPVAIQIFSPRGVDLSNGLVSGEGAFISAMKINTPIRLPTGGSNMVKSYPHPLIKILDVYLEVKNCQSVIFFPQSTCQNIKLQPFRIDKVKIY